MYYIIKSMAALLNGCDKKFLLSQKLFTLLFDRLKLIVK